MTFYHGLGQLCSVSLFNNSAIYRDILNPSIANQFLPNNIGVPQGSNLGPLFFLIFFNDLPTFISEDLDCYADDSTMGATGINVHDIWIVACLATGCLKTASN